jgi:hypothetical protein
VSDTDELTLLDQVLEVTGLEREDGESAEDFKARIVRAMQDKFPNTEEGNEAFEDLDEDVQEWVNAATEVVKNNRGARNKKPLPELDGLAEDEAKPKAKRAAKAAKEPKEKKERAPRGPIVRKELAVTFDAAPEDAKVSKKIDAPLRAAGFKRQKDRSKAGHFVYSNEKTGAEIHVGPGKGENVYMMGWRPKGDKQHQYGGPALEKYLAEAA